MGMKSLSPRVMGELVTLQTLNADYVRFERLPSLHSQLTHQTWLFTAFINSLWLLYLERSHKVDLGRCRSQEPIQSLRLEGKGLRRTQIGCECSFYLRKIPVNESFTGISLKWGLDRELHTSVHTYVEGYHFVMALWSININFTVNHALSIATQHNILIFVEFLLFQ